MKGSQSKTTKADGKLSTKKKIDKKAKDPNKPKRPPSAFFVFLDEFRKQFKQDNPDNKNVSVVSKAGGEKWRSMSDADRAPYAAKAEKFKSEYVKKMSAYEKGELKNDEEESEKSKSELNDGESDDGDEDSL